MSEILERTWSYLTSAGSSPKWTIPSNQSTPASHLPHGLGQFIKAVFDAPTAQHESEIVQAQLKAVHSKLQEPNLKTSTLTDCIVRAMLCSLLGYPVEFAQIHALQLAQKGSVTEKKIGYMGCVTLLTEDSDLILLLINTIVRDLKSSNVVENNMALMTASALVPKEMAGMLIPAIVEKIAHSKDFIRKKALVCLEQIAVKDPVGYSNLAIETSIQCLADKDPGVAMVAIQVLNRLDLSGLDDVSEVIASLIAIQDQILTQKLPKEFIFHGACAPWAQMDILKLLKCFKDRMSVEENHQVNQLVLRTLEQPFTDSIGQAVVYECIRTLASTLNPDYVNYHTVIKRLSKYLTSLLQSEHNNEKFIGLCALERLLDSSATSFPLSDRERTLVLQALDDPDPSIQRKSFALIDAMANEENASEVCEKIVAQQKSLNDEVFKSMLIEKAVGIIEDHSQTLQLEWRTFILLRLLQSAKANHQKNVIMTKLQTLFKKPLTDEQLGIGSKLTKVLSSPANEAGAPETLLILYIWALAQFSTGSSETCCNAICKVVEQSNYKESVSAVALKHLFNVITTRDLEIHTLKRLTGFLCTLKTNCLTDAVQDAIEELEIVLKVVDADAMKEIPKFEGHPADFTCTYLDHVVVKAIEQGYPVYQSTDIFKDVLTSHAITTPKSLRFTPYNLMTESSDILSTSINRQKNPSSSSGSAAKVPEVWSLKGRKHEVVEPLDEHEVRVASPTNKPLSQQTLGDSVIEDINEWK